MRYLALASDYDGTLAKDGRVTETTLAALKKLQQTGRKLLLVTGRRLDELRQVFPQINVFDCVIAENGALIYWTQTQEIERLGDRPSKEFIQALRDRQVEPLAVGEVIVATWEPHETTVLETIRAMGLELQVISNKGAVMILPSGLDKAAGLRAALTRMGLLLHDVVGVGDAENDYAFLEICGYSVAVNNALPTLKEKVDWVTASDRGEGVEELIEQLILDDRV
jgi:phosphoglycolate phosphatase (TIGR01487 family)